MHGDLLIALSEREPALRFAINFMYSLPIKSYKLESEGEFDYDQLTLIG